MNAFLANEPEAPPVSRRTFVRVGAHAGWAVPAISVATASPVLAVSAPGQATLSVTGYALVAFPGPAGVGGYNGTLTVTSDRSYTKPVQVVVTIPKGTQRLATAPTLDERSVSSGWVGSGPGGDASVGPWTYTFVRGGGLEGAGVLTFKLFRTTTSAGSIHVVWTTASASGAGAISGPPDKDDIV